MPPSSFVGGYTVFGNERGGLACAGYEAWPGGGDQNPSCPWRIMDLADTTGLVILAGVVRIPHARRDHPADSPGFDLGSVSGPRRPAFCRGRNSVGSASTSDSQSVAETVAESQSFGSDPIGPWPRFCAPFVLLPHGSKSAILANQYDRSDQTARHARYVIDTQIKARFPSWTSRVRSPSPALRINDARAISSGPLFR